MSEQTRSDKYAPPQEYALDKEAQRFQTEKPICSSDIIGLSPVLVSGETTTVVAFVDVRSSDGQEVRAAIVRISALRQAEEEAANDQFVIWGLVDSRVQEDEAMVAPIEQDANPVEIGRAGLDLWRGALRENPHASRRHTSVRVVDGVLEVADTSGEGNATVVEGQLFAEEVVSGNADPSILSDEVISEPEPEAAEEETQSQVESERVVELADIMSSPEAMLNALHSRELSFDVKSQLHQIVSAWSRFKLATATRQAWEEVVMPQLDRLDGPLQDMGGRLHRASGEIEQLVGGLNQLATAAEYGDYETMGDLGRRYKFVQQFDGILRSLQPVMVETGLGENVRRLDADQLESSENLRRLRRGESSEEFSVDDAAELLSAVEIRAGTTAADIRGQIEGLDESGLVSKLSRRRETVEAMIQFARIANNDPLVQDYMATKQIIMNRVEELFSGRSRMTSVEVHMLRSYVEAQLLEPLRQVEKFVRLAALYQKEAAH